MPDDGNRSAQNDSQIIAPIVSDNTVNENRSIAAVADSSNALLAFNINERHWDNISGLAASGVFIIEDDRSQIHILARGTDNALWDNVDGVWQGLGGAIAFDPCAVRDSLGVIHASAVGIDGALFDWSSVTGWTNLGGHAASNPSAALSPDGHIKIAVKSDDGELLIKDLTTGEWSNLGGKIASNPHLIFDLQGKMHILARGSDGALWDNVDGTWQNRSGMI
ncbi:MAG: hypothetical protein PHQ34_09225, partial [Methanothrix sp.]|nr:hypothetical protein [Methanothrix sp.]